MVMVDWDESILKGANFAFLGAFNLVLKLTKLTTGKSYTMIVYARTADGKVATFSVSKLITIN